MKIFKFRYSYFVFTSLECPQELRYKWFISSKIEGKITSKSLDLLRLLSHIVISVESVLLVIRLEINQYTNLFHLYTAVTTWLIVANQKKTLLELDIHFRQIGSHEHGSSFWLQCMNMYTQGGKSLTPHACALNFT